MIKLRPYQIKLISDLRQEFSRKKSLIMCLPTGAGKTVVFTSICAATLQKSLTSRVMILTDRKELLTQAGGTLQHFGLHPELITADARETDKHKRLFVGMVETVARRGRKLADLYRAINLLIIDEAHKGNFRKVLAMFPNARVIGATATPISASKKHPLNESFSGIVEGPTIAELIELGYLSEARTFTVKDDLSDLETARNGDYTGASLDKHFNKHELRLGVVEQYRRTADGSKAIVFNCSVQHSKDVCQAFVDAGYKAKHLDANTPGHVRMSTLYWFRHTPGAILCNCSILTTGFDEPTIETVIVNRATKSLPLWLQMCGRGSRVLPNKKQFTILDMGANVISGGMGLWEADRDWSSAFRNAQAKEGTGDGVAPVKECPNCGALVPASAPKCKHCGYVFPEKRRQSAELEEVKKSLVARALPPHLQKPVSKMTVRELIERASIGSLATGLPYKHAWIVRQLKDRGEEALHEYARLKGYKSGWVWRQING